MKALNMGGPGEYGGPLPARDEGWPPITASRPCACTGPVTAWIVENLTFALMEKHYGRRVTRETPVAWERCPVCRGSGVDRRP